MRLFEQNLMVQRCFWKKDILFVLYKMEHLIKIRNAEEVIFKHNLH